VDRPKAGFSVPIDAWLRGPLRDWGEELLDANAGAGALLDLAALRMLWQRHLRVRADLGLQLWPCLSFLAWHQHWMCSDPVASRPDALE
jgi:asparagine synthase (glutamine-hydrolysing)